MKKLLPFLSGLWLLLLLFPLVPGSFAQTLSGGAEVKVRLLEQLDTSETKGGQLFSATVAEPVVYGKRTILTRGTAVQGRVTDVIRPGRLHQPASFTLQLTNIIGTRGAGGLQAQALHIDGQSHAVRNVALIGGGAAAGAILGGVADGKKGALIGTAVGAGAGTATAYLTGKQELVLPVETLLTFVVAAESLAVPETRAPAVVESAARRGRGDARSDLRRDDQDAYDALIFSERDQSLIRAYFRPRGGRGLPPGLAKRNGNLPPGLEKQMQRNGTLPPGLQKRVEPFPEELNRQLPRLPVGYSRVIIEGRAMNVGSDNRVVDVMVVF
jgi:hypothetical protein